MPKLTQSFVKSVAGSPDGKQTFYMDDELTGFGLRVSANKKVFYLQMRVGRKVLKRKIGEYGPMTVDQARKGALLVKAQLIEGKDPYDERQPSGGDATLEEMFDEYRDEVSHRANTKKSIDSAKRHFAGLEGKAYKTKPNGRSNEKVEIVKVKLPNWLQRPFQDISQDEVLARFDLVSRMLPKRRPAKGAPKPITRTSNQHFKYLQAAYNYRISKYKLSRTGFSNPVTILKTARRWHRINRRHGFLDTTKPYFVQWWKACEALDGVVGDYILFTLITASRSIESATLRWTDVNFKTGDMVFRETKNGQDYTFPIAPLARDILKRRHKEKVNDFVFGYRGSKKGHVVCPPQYHIKLVREACGQHWAMHDLRRTFTTAMTRLNVHAFTISHLMKHSSNSSMTLSYAPPTREQLLKALTMLEQHLLEQVHPPAAGGEPAALVEVMA